MPDLNNPLPWLNNEMTLGEFIRGKNAVTEAWQRCGIKSTTDKDTGARFFVNSSMTAGCEHSWFLGFDKAVEVAKVFVEVIPTGRVEIFRNDDPLRIPYVVWGVEAKVN